MELPAIVGSALAHKDATPSIVVCALLQMKGYNLPDEPSADAPQRRHVSLRGHRQ